MAEVVNSTTDAEIRAEIKTLLLEIPGLGGPDDAASRHVHAFGFEVDDEKETKQFWQSLEGNVPVINGAMVTRLAREDQEPFAGREFAFLHRYRILFRYGNHLDPRAEEKFGIFVDAIHDRLRSAALFKRDGLHPAPFSTQTASSTMRNIKLFHTRTWEAEIEFTVTEQVFQSEIA